MNPQNKNALLAVSTNLSTIIEQILATKEFEQSELNTMEHFLKIGVPGYRAQAAIDHLENIEDKLQQVIDSIDAAIE